jgi:hypothetical protein
MRSQLNNKATILDLRKIKSTIHKILHLQKQVSNQVGTNLFDNYKYREWLLVESLNSKLRTSIVMQKQRSGPDAINNGRTVEIKTCSLKPRVFVHSLCEPDFKKSFEWDKQNDPKRRQETLDDEEYIFGMFTEHRCAFAFYVNCPKEVKKVHALLKEKQRAFLACMEENKKNNKRMSRDSIRITLDELGTKRVQGHQFILGADGQEFVSYGVMNPSSVAKKNIRVFGNKVCTRSKTVRSKTAQKKTARSSNSTQQPREQKREDLLLHRVTRGRVGKNDYRKKK